MDSRASKSLVKKQEVLGSPAEEILSISMIGSDPTYGPVYFFSKQDFVIDYSAGGTSVFTIEPSVKLYRDVNNIVFHYAYQVSVGPNSAAKQVSTKTTYGVTIHFQLRDKDGNVFGGTFQANPYHSNLITKFGTIKFGESKQLEKLQSRPLGTDLAEVVTVGVGTQIVTNQVDIVY
nr:hypothetical protein [Mesorhizobium sp.]